MDFCFQLETTFLRNSLKKAEIKLDTTKNEIWKIISDWLNPDIGAKNTPHS